MPYTVAAQRLDLYFRGGKITKRINQRRCNTTSN
jgi:hypothetical protein